MIPNGPSYFGDATFTFVAKNKDSIYRGMSEKSDIMKLLYFGEDACIDTGS